MFDALLFILWRNRVKKRTVDCRLSFMSAYKNL